MTYWPSSVSYNVGESPSLESAPSQRNFTYLLISSRLQKFARQLHCRSVVVGYQAAVHRACAGVAGSQQVPFDVWQSQEFLRALADWDIDGLVGGGVELVCCVLYAVLGAGPRLTALNAPVRGLRRKPPAPLASALVHRTNRVRHGNR